MDQLPRLGKRELICLLLFTCNYVVFVWRGFLFLWVLGMGNVILLWHSLSLPYNHFGFENCGLLEIVHTQFLRSILRARKSTPLYMLDGELGRFPIELSIKCRMINYWVHLISQNIESKISFKIYQKLRATPTITSKWIQKIKEIFEVYRTS